MGASNICVPHATHLVYLHVILFIGANFYKWHITKLKIQCLTFKMIIILNYYYIH